MGDKNLIDLIYNSDDEHLQEAFAQFVVYYGLMYNEMEKRGLIANPYGKK